MTICQLVNDEAHLESNNIFLACLLSLLNIVPRKMPAPPVVSWRLATLSHVVSNSRIVDRSTKALVGMSFLKVNVGGLEPYLD